MPGHDAALRTRRSFGLLWRETAEGRVPVHGLTHVERAARAGAVALPVRGRRILDAGCGAGADVVRLSELHPGATVLGLDANDAIDVAANAVADREHAYVVRGSVLEPPLADDAFDLVYSYGVLHHTDDPAGAFASLARLVAPDGTLLVYVYTDLREEPWLRALLTLVTLARRVTTRLPPAVVLKLARLASPLVFVGFAVPAALIRRLPGGRRYADRIPFNFVRRPGAAVGDLFDRFSAPVEHRHSRAEVASWYRQARMEDVVVASMPDARGWVGSGRRPSGGT